MSRQPHEPEGRDVPTGEAFRSPDAGPPERWDAPWLDDRAPGARLIRGVWYTMVVIAIVAVGLVAIGLIRIAARGG